MTTLITFNIENVLCKNFKKSMCSSQNLTSEKRALLSLNFLAGHLTNVKKIYNLLKSKTIFIIHAESDKDLFIISSCPEYFECKIRYENVDNLNEKRKVVFADLEDGDFGVITFSGNTEQSMTFKANICFEELEKIATSM
ncbi:MAG TPA: hypothetical protein PKD85_06885 [Saprospiraceae bacterium]|nr:hypothetical protein [Saprospiraceae bacterium]